MTPPETASPEDWLVGAAGVWAGHPERGWRRLGAYRYPVNALLRRPEEVVAATEGGLWSSPADGGRWVQLHDETLTAVMDLTVDAAGAVVAAGAYGVHVARHDESGVPRWRCLTEARAPDERFANRVVVAGDDWLAGVEAGVLVSRDGGHNWSLTNLRDTAVRALERHDGAWWAGSDRRGLWRSDDGHCWHAVDTPTEAVFSFAVDGPHWLLGGYDGIYHRRGDGAWRRSGPQALIRCLGAADGLWLAGADPGGLWVSTDCGASWARTGDFENVRALAAPQEG